MKKNIFLALVLCCICITVKGQISKGNWMLGGDVIVKGFKHEDSEKYLYYAELFPKVGYFVSDKLVVGGEVGFYKAENSSLYTSFVPFCRYYLLDYDKKNNPFVEGGVGFKYHEYNKLEESLTELMHYFKAGVSAFFTNSTALNITLNYKRNSFQFDKEISMAVGVQIHLEKKR
ncbi:hypothetical protein SAMN05444411_1036 [Lutibacter oricola]|uniref:Outer membrane protein beta-barrel domain-containing protein n=1 Tax=Lutibacter oricola TaxID=762486 RepID=A0A1H2YNG5_9FLAO|nr:hypothetical protein [Lutibacter oricola]SDX06525.1 hypothetical protein SAMN05444411_1036 [Lutibacter oricola]